MTDEAFLLPWGRAVGHAGVLALRTGPRTRTLSCPTLHRQQGAQRGARPAAGGARVTGNEEQSSFTQGSALQSTDKISLKSVTKFVSC